MDEAGRVWVAEAESGKVRRIDLDGSVRTVAGTGRLALPSPSGTLATRAVLHNPTALAADNGGNVFLAETGMHRVYQITPGGELLLVAGGDSPPPEEDLACYSSSLSAGKDTLVGPRAIALDAAGNLYIADTGQHRIVRRDRVSGALRTVAGTGVAGTDGDGGPATKARITEPVAIAVKPDGSIYIVPARGRLRRVRPDGIIETPSAQPPESPESVAVDADGRLIFGGGMLQRESPSGGIHPVRGNVFRVAAAGSGLIYGTNNGVIFAISPECHVAPFIIRDAGLGWPQALAADGRGGLVVSLDRAIWRTEPLPLPPATVAALPSLLLDRPGIVNAASDYIATVVTSGGRNPFRLIYERVNDAIAAEEILRIRGGCMGPLEPAQGPETPSSLAGVRVRFDGEPARLLRAQSADVLALAPRDIAGKRSVRIRLEYRGAFAEETVGVTVAAPGVFVNAPAQAAALNGDGSVNSEANPARAGSVVSLFLTGAGLTRPRAEGTTGEPLLELPVTVLVGGLAAEVLYAGAAPGLPGVAQVNVRIPATGLRSGSAPLTVAVGPRTAPQALTLAVAAASSAPAEQP